MTTILLPFLVCVSGLLIWAVAASHERPNVYLTEGGEVAYAFGLLVTLFVLSTTRVVFSEAVSSALPFVVCIVGLFVWILASNGVLKRAGKIAFAFGLLVTLFEVATHIVRL